jgi:hypothetical protein
MAADFRRWAQISNISPEDLSAGTTRKTWESRKSISLDEKDLNEGDHIEIDMKIEAKK